VNTASIIKAMMEAVKTSEKYVYFDETTRRYTPESCIFVVAAVRT
jgi:hypothetical protein